MRLTYCPGRNASRLNASPLIDRAMVLADNWRTSLMAASKLACSVLHSCEDAGMRSTQSASARIWQVST
ncbi:hypothetical protein D3C80_1886710 [compost metagenome]